MASVLSGPLGNLALVFGLIQASRMVDMNDAQNILLLRIIYGAVQLVIVAACLIVRSKVYAINDVKTKVTYTLPPKPMSNEPASEETVTACQYDLDQVQQLLRQTLMGAAILLFVHLKWNVTQPLLLQCVLPLKNLFTSPVIRVHLLGQPAEGNLARPWAAPSNPFASLQNKETEPAQDALRRNRAQSTKAARARKEQ